jgi:hypothetical protein
LLVDASQEQSAVTTAMLRGVRERLAPAGDG